MAISVDESFDIAVAPEQAWAYLTDPARVVACLPGAELLEIEDPRTFVGRVKIKVGPVTAAFRGRARFEEVDDSARRVRMTGKGQETAGSGSATMNMTSEVEALPDGGSRVRVHAEVDVVGRLMQFGRGMMDEVSRQIFAQFASCVRSTLEADAAPAAPAGAGGIDSGASVPVDALREESAPVPRPAPQPRTESIDALPLLWRSVRSRVRRLFRSGSADS